jgi:hypothetical protein
MTRANTRASRLTLTNGTAIPTSQRSVSPKFANAAVVCVVASRCTWNFWDHSSHAKLAATLTRAENVLHLNRKTVAYGNGFRRFGGNKDRAAYPGRCGGRSKCPFSTAALRVRPKHGKCSAPRPGVRERDWTRDVDHHLNRSVRRDGCVRSKLVWHSERIQMLGRPDVQDVFDHRRRCLNGLTEVIPRHDRQRVTITNDRHHAFA